MKAMKALFYLTRSTTESLTIFGFKIFTDAMALFAKRLLFGGGPLEIPGGEGGLTIPKKNSCKGNIFPKKFVQAVHHQSKVKCCLLVVPIIAEAC